MKNHNNKVKRQYKILSGIYDWMDKIFFPLKSRNPRLGLSKLIPDEKLSVLDVCCGTGNSILAIASKNCMNQLTGIDLSGDMLRIAREKAYNLGIKDLHLLQMDAVKLDFKDGFFDIATISLALHEMPRDVFHGVLSEMARVTRKGGKVLILDWDKPQSLTGRILFGVFPTLAEPRGFRDFLKLDWNKLLQRYGLTVKEVPKYTFSKIVIAAKE